MCILSINVSKLCGYSNGITVKNCIVFINISITAVLLVPYNGIIYQCLQLQFVNVPYWYSLQCAGISIISQCINILYWYSLSVLVKVSLSAQFNAVHVYIHIWTCVPGSVCNLTIYQCSQMCPWSHSLSQLIRSVSQSVSVFIIPSLQTNL